MLPVPLQGGRIVFEVAADYSEAGRGWRDMLRLWVSEVIVLIIIFIFMSL